MNVCFWQIVWNFKAQNKNMHFAQLNIPILQENATVDFSFVLQIIFVSCVHRCYIQKHALPSLFCENESLVRFRG